MDAQLLKRGAIPIELVIALSRETRRHSVTPVGYSVLRVIHHRGIYDEYSTPSALANTLGYTTAASTGTLDRLEKLGLIYREHLACDRRVIAVRLTKEGRLVLESIESGLRAVADKLGTGVQG